jgi:hypothetical protein
VETRQLLFVKSLLQILSKPLYNTGSVMMFMHAGDSGSDFFASMMDMATGSTTQVLQKQQIS